MMQTNPFNKFPDNARLWLYQTNRALTTDEQSLLKGELNHFTKEWAAHGNKLWGDAAIINPYFVGFVVDESQTPPSGCSIDASVKFLKTLGEKLKIDFFNRLNIVLWVDDNYKIDSFHSINKASYSGDELVFDPIISTLKGLKNWPLPLKESSFSSLFE